MTEENGGGLSPSGRFQRMEESLARIEDKLDNDVISRLTVLEREDAIRKAIEQSSTSKRSMRLVVVGLATTAVGTLINIVYTLQHVHK